MQYNILLTHSSFGGHLGCFYFLSIINNAIDIHVQNVIWTYVFISFEYTPRSGIVKMITNLKSAFMTLMKSLNYTDILS